MKWPTSETDYLNSILLLLATSVNIQYRFLSTDAVAVWNQFKEPSPS